eukprot:4612984-Prymnesium_polylepis.1
MSKKLRLAQRVGLNQAPVVPEVKITPSEQPDSAALPRKKQRSSDPVPPSTQKPTPAAPVAAAPAAATPAAAAGRKWTVSIALPGSIVDNAQTQELRSYLVGQVARSCAIFNVDEIVVFHTETGPAASAAMASADERKGRTSGAVFMARVLQYLECPQYLRKACFPHHPCAALTLTRL